ncbi:MAG: nucleotidyltransferase, partial [Deltaproteobacteria bacterium HGW-Deltaproteobacteria-20]
AAALQAEKKYRAAMRHWEAYEAWKAQRNPARAQLEQKHGYDTKHAMHLVRLMRMGLEALRTGDLLVRRPDAQELVAIRNGALSFDELLAEAASLREEMDDAAGRSRLPDEVNPDVADRVLFEMITQARA